MRIEFSATSETPIRAEQTRFERRGRASLRTIDESATVHSSMESSILGFAVSPLPANSTNGAPGGDVGALEDGKVHFATLLSQLRRLNFTSIEKLTPQASPSQMFDAPVSDRHARRRAKLQSETPAESIEESDARLSERTNRIDEAASAKPDTKNVRPFSRREQQPTNPQALRRDSQSLIPYRLSGYPTRNEIVAAPGIGEQIGPAHDAARKQPIASQFQPGGVNPSQTRPAFQGSAMLPDVQSSTTRGDAVRSSPAVSLARQVGEILSAEKPNTTTISRPANENPMPRTDAALKRGETENTSSKPTENDPSSHEKTPRSDAAREAPTSAFDKLVRSMRFRTGERQSTARLQLTPPRLGRILVDVRMAGDDVRIGVRAETSEAARMLADRAEALRNSLQSQGIRVAEFTVSSTEAPSPSVSVPFGASTSPKNDPSSPARTRLVEKLRTRDRVRRERERFKVESESADSASESRLRRVKKSKGG